MRKLKTFAVLIIVVFFLNKRNEVHELITSLGKKWNIFISFYKKMISFGKKSLQWFSYWICCWILEKFNLYKLCWTCQIRESFQKFWKTFWKKSRRKGIFLFVDSITFLLTRKTKSIMNIRKNKVLLEIQKTLQIMFRGKRQWQQVCKHLKKVMRRRILKITDEPKKPSILKQVKKPNLMIVFSTNLRLINRFFREWTIWMQSFERKKNVSNKISFSRRNHTLTFYVKEHQTMIIKKTEEMNPKVFHISEWKSFEKSCEFMNVIFFSFF